MAQKKATVPTSDRWALPWETIGISVSLVVLILVVFSQVTSYGFIELDDPTYVTQNFVVGAGITRPGIGYAFTSFDMGSWHPLTWLSHMMDVQLYGLDPAGHHATNLVFHCVNTILLFLLCQRLTGAQGRSAMLAALFAIHPLHVEPVVWIASRKDMLSTFFLFLAFLAWTQYTRTSPRLKWYFVTVLVYACALMSKPNVVVFPILLLLLDYWPLKRFGATQWRLLLIEKFPFAAMAAVISFVTYYGQKTAGALIASSSLTLSARAMNAILSYGIYLLKTFWPYGLSPHYPFAEPMPTLWVAVSLAVLLAISAAVILARKRYPYLVTGWFWFLLATVPMLGLIQTGVQAYADRYVFISHIGLFLAIVWLVPDLIGYERVSSLAGRCATGLILFVLVWRAYGQATYWQNTYTLFHHAVDVTRNNGPAHLVLGIVYKRDKRPDDAVAELRKAAELMPNHPPVFRHLAEALYMQGKLDESLKTIDHAIELYPSAGNSYQNKGLILRALNRGPEALAAFQKSLELGIPADVMPSTYVEMGLILTKDKRWEDSIPYFQAALQVNPYYYLAQKNLAFSYMNSQKWDYALREFDILSRINPQDEDVMESLRFLRNRVK